MMLMEKTSCLCRIATCIASQAFISRLELPNAMPLTALACRPATGALASPACRAARRANAAVICSQPARHEQQHDAQQKQQGRREALLRLTGAVAAVPLLAALPVQPAQANILEVWAEDGSIRCSA